jgi:nickel transport protein
MNLRVIPALLLLASAAPAHSHAIESSLERLSSLTDQLVLDSRFGNGEPADDAVVRLVPPNGEPIEVGRTDASGQLRFQLPSNATSAWELQVDRGPGHRDYLELLGAAPALSTGFNSSRPGHGIRPGLALLGLSAAAGALGGALSWRRGGRS